MARRHNATTGFQTETTTSLRARPWGGEGITDRGFYYVQTWSTDQFARVNPIGRQLGSGRSALVRERTDTKNGKTVACKEFIPKPNVPLALFETTFDQEVRSMLQAQFHHCVEVCSAFTLPPGLSEGKSFCIAMRPIADQTLEQVVRAVRNNGPWHTERQEKIMLNAFGCLALTFTFLHSQDLAWQKDIKPRYILIHGSKVYLSDLGSSHVRSGHDEYQYTPPEHREDGFREPRNPRSDVFSLGATFMAIPRALSRDEGTNYLQPDNDFDSFGNGTTIDRRVEFLQKIWPTDDKPARRTIASLVCGMIQAEPNDRMSSKSVCEQLWSTGVNCRESFFCQECRDYVVQHGIPQAV